MKHQKDVAADYDLLPSSSSFKEAQDKTFFPGFPLHVGRTSASDVLLAFPATFGYANNLVHVPQP